MILRSKKQRFGGLMFYFTAFLFVTHLSIIFRNIDRRSRGLILDIEKAQASLQGSREAPEWLKQKILQFELAGECYLKDLQSWEWLMQRELFLRRGTASAALVHWSHLVVVYALLGSLGSKVELGSIIVSGLLYGFLLILLFRMGKNQIIDQISRHRGVKSIKLYEVEKRLVHRYGVYRNWARTVGTLCELIFLGLGIKEFWAHYREVFL